jgi:uncharacterized protein (DUF2249 family)
MLFKPMANCDPFSWSVPDLGQWRGAGESVCLAPWSLSGAFQMHAQPAFDSNTHIFDARGVARRFRHSAIFGAIGVLRSGETMRFVNDHDPLPLIAQLRERLGENLTVTYRERSTDAVVIDFGIVGLPTE